MANYITRAQKVSNMVQELEICTTTENLNAKNFGSEEYLKCRKMISGWMEEIGLETTIDNIGNIRGLLRSANPSAKTFVIGSHYALPGGAGMYDGSLGIAAGIDLANQLIVSKVALPFHLEIIALTGKDGVRFHTPFMGSSVIAGTFDPLLLDKKDDNGITLAEAVASHGKKPEKINADNIPSGNWLGYFEIHMEQGPLLSNRNLPVGIVTAIAGQRRVEIHFAGKKGHSGTVPMGVRKDALCAAAQFILEVEEYASPDRRNMVATVGKIRVDDAAANSIPAMVTCTLDIRSADPARLPKAYENLYKICERICHKRGIYFEWKLIHETNPVFCDENLRSLLRKSISRKKLEIAEMISGASHDAAVIAKIAPVSMLFVKSVKGNNRENVEHVDVKDIATALDISEHFLKLLLQDVQQKQAQSQ